MVKRNIVVIDEAKCDGCGLCVPNCHEGAIQIIDGKAKLLNESYCDGLGNCLGHCPQDAINILEKEVSEFDFEATNENLKVQGRPELKSNPLEGNKMECECPGSKVQTKNESNSSSALKQWPIQLNLVPPTAPFFDNSHLLIAADCVPFATPEFHSKLLNGKSLAIGCPKLDDSNHYQDKLTEVFKLNKIKSVTVAVMEVPCCQGLISVVKTALNKADKEIPLIIETIGVGGDIK
jgi:Pyruvate/2-oxoacid:ferredoxin oxidoreductase delta subunit